MEKLFSVIPKYYVASPPNYKDKIYPKLIVLIIIAYIVASIFLGQRRHARIRIGNAFNSANIIMIEESQIQNILSGIPSYTFTWVTRSIYVRLNVTHISVVTIN